MKNKLKNLNIRITDGNSIYSSRPFEEIPEEEVQIIKDLTCAVKSYIDIFKTPPMRGVQFFVESQSNYVVVNWVAVEAPDILTVDITWDAGDHNRIYNNS